MLISFVSFFVLLIFFTVFTSHYLPQKNMTNFSPETFTKSGMGVPSTQLMQNKLIFLVVDGLSYRFVDKLTKNMGDLDQKNLSNIGQNDASNIEGHLTALKKFKLKYPKKTILEPAYHSSPTWTIHGIKTLITGALPTESLKDMLFKENKNFEVLMDGLKGERKAYFIGDVYWKYFIDEITQKWSKVEFTNWFGSKTNQDTKVVNKVMDIMENDPDFDVIFSHFSDLDSSVHKKKLSSQDATDAIDRDQILLTQFLEKLEVLEQKCAEKGQDVTLILTSDHGLIENGHGGASDNEKLSLLFAYSSRGFAANKKSENGLFGLKGDVAALDLTEMTSYYMGLTPPFNSIGSFKLGFLPLYKKQGGEELSENQLFRLFVSYEEEILK